MFASTYHGIFMYIFTLAVFVIFGWYKQTVTMHYANCSAEHRKMVQTTQW